MTVRLLFLLFLAMPLTALASDPHTEIVKHIKAPQLVGAGDLSLLWISVYTASLWASGPSWTADQPFALSILYDMDFTQDDLVDRTIDEMARRMPLTEAAKYRVDLQNAFPQVTKGDRITGIFLPPKKTIFYHNGVPTTTIVGADFADTFFGIWLHEDTSEPDLRLALLGQQPE